MPRRTKKQIRKEKRIMLALAGLLAFAIVVVAFQAVPGLQERLFDLFGLRGRTVVARVVDTPTAVHFIDVGQGDAVLLEQDGQFALVDAGPPEGQEALLSYLRGAGVERLAWVFMTHPHADHIGGMQAAIEAFGTDAVIVPDFTLAPTPTSLTFERLVDCLLTYDIPTRVAAVGDVFPLGGAVVTVLHGGVEAKSNLNHLSLMLLFEAEDFRFLATGDAEKANEEAALLGSAGLRADVFHAGHHGSSTSNTEGFVNAVHPALVVVSCGVNNSYGHPHRDALQSFEGVGATVLRTDLHGHVMVQPDGEGGIAYNAERGAA